MGPFALGESAVEVGRARRTWQLERAVLRDAAGLVYVASGQGEVLAKKHPFVADMPKCLVYNGFEASEMSPARVRPSDRPTILHGGNLYGTRRVDGLLAALAILRQRGRPESAGAVFQNFGSATNTDMLTRGAAHYGVTAAVQTGETLPRREFLSACRGADVLLVPVGHDAPPAQHAGAIPSKLYDYFSACRPILVVGPRDCEAARMVRRLNRGLAAPDDAPDQIAAAIDQLLQGRGASGKLDLSLEAVAEFESSATVRKMADFFSTVTFG